MYAILQWCLPDGILVFLWNIYESFRPVLITKYVVSAYLIRLTQYYFFSLALYTKHTLAVLFHFCVWVLCQLFVDRHKWLLIAEGLHSADQMHRSVIVQKKSWWNLYQYKDNQKSKILEKFLHKQVIISHFCLFFHIHYLILIIVLIMAFFLFFFSPGR